MKNKRTLVAVGKRSKADGRSFRYIDQEVIHLFREVLQMYGTSGTKIMFKAITEGKIKPKL